MCAVATQRGWGCGAPGGARESSAEDMSQFGLRFDAVHGI